MSELLPQISAKLKPLVERCLFLFCVLIAYLVCGALLFQSVEFSEREESIEEATLDLEKERAEFLQVLWAETIAKTEDDWMELANTKLDMYEKSLKIYFKQGIDLQDDIEAEEGDLDNPWSFSGSFFYCFTVVTTIGYGNMCPGTVFGKLATIAYGLVGIPLTLCILTEIGRLLSLTIKYLAAVKFPNLDSSDEFNFSLTVSLSITGSYLLVGSLVFCYFEDWSVVDSSYFSFVTFSTIGFGDMVPSSLDLNLFFLLYILTAMALCSMCFAVVQCRLADQLDVWQSHIVAWWHQHEEKIRLDDTNDRERVGSQSIPEIRRQMWDSREGDVVEEEEVEGDE